MGMRQSSNAPVPMGATNGVQFQGGGVPFGAPTGKVTPASPPASAQNHAAFANANQNAAFNRPRAESTMSAEAVARARVDAEKAEAAHRAAQKAGVPQVKPGQITPLRAAVPQSQMDPRAQQALAQVRSNLNGKQAPSAAPAPVSAPSGKQAPSAAPAVMTSVSNAVPAILGRIVAR